MAHNPITVNRDSVVQFCFFGTFAWLIYQLFLLSRPFLPGLLYAGILAVAFFPVYARLNQAIPNRSVASLVMTLGTLLLAVLPLIAIFWLLFREADRLVPLAQELIEDIHKSDLSSIKNHLPEVLLRPLRGLHHLLISIDIDLNRLVMNNVGELGVMLTTSGALLARHALFAVFNGVILTIMLFFAYRDGERAWRWLINAIPLRQQHKDALTRRAYDTFRAVMIGTLATAAAQGFLAMVGFFIAGVKLPILLGVATAFASLLGASLLVTLPVALWTIGPHPNWGVFLLLWAFLVVGLADNVLKPILIGSRARLPFVLIFFSILGGIKLYGAIGFILGPILVASVLTFLKLYQEDYPT